MKAIKWIGPPQFTDFGRVDTGDIVHFESYPHLFNLDLVAERWVQQGYAEPYEEPAAEPVKEVFKKRKIKEVSHG